MKIWEIEDFDGYGYGLFIVRAKTKAEARKIWKQCTRGLTFIRVEEIYNWIHFAETSDSRGATAYKQIARSKKK